MTRPKQSLFPSVADLLRKVERDELRQWTCSCSCKPLAGRRVVRVTERRTRIDWAYALLDFIDQYYADAEKSILVMDNLNTQNPSSLHEAFDPTETHTLTNRLEIHNTPKHGNWLNIAECKLSVLQRQCLDRRIETAEFFRH